jgi:hypothetical protein
MAFALPPYQPPDFTAIPLRDAPLVTFNTVELDGVAPEDYHATSVFPEYFHIRPGQWQLLIESRMDCVVVQRPDESLEAVEFRRLRRGDRVACGRTEDGEQGIYVHDNPFCSTGGTAREKFAFRTRTTRESSFSVDYDLLLDLLQFERKHGFILWVLGPAITFDRDARRAFVEIIARGYVNGLLAGNALAVHDLEAALFGTALGQEIYTKQHVFQGHYKHLDTINQLRRAGSLGAALEIGMVPDGIMRALIEHRIPHVLAGSIRDDGPLPGVIGDAYLAQERMRALTRQATTIIALATQLHAIATGNMTPCYKVVDGQALRPVYFYSVDMSEFAADKLADRGSLTARAILTNVQDFVVLLQRGLA